MADAIETIRELANEALSRQDDLENEFGERMPLMRMGLTALAKGETNLRGPGYEAGKLFAFMGIHQFRRTFSKMNEHGFPVDSYVLEVNGEEVRVSVTCDDPISNWIRGVSTMAMRSRTTKTDESKTGCLLMMAIAFVAFSTIYLCL